jgi:hypothetical protein
LQLEVQQVLQVLVQQVQRQALKYLVELQSSVLVVCHLLVRQQRVQ